MKNVNEFTGVFNKEKLHLGNVLGGGETRYFYQSLSEYQVLNFSVCVPSNLTVALNCDGYDFVAYQSNGHYGYTNSPLMVAIVNQPLQGVQFDGVSSQLSFLNKIVNELQNQFKLLSVNETIINGYPALVINQEITVSGSHTSALFIANHTLTQLSISFNDSYSNAKELTQLILDSFTVSSSSNSTAQRGNSSQSVHLSWNHSSSIPSHSLTPVNQGSNYCDSNRVNQDSHYCDSNRGDRDSHYHDSNRVNQDSHYCDSNRVNQDSQCYDSNRVNSDSHYCNSNGVNQDSHYCNSNGVNQDSNYCDSNRVNQDSHYCNSSGVNQGSQCYDSNRVNQDSHYGDSNGVNQDSHYGDSNGVNQDSNYCNSNGVNQGSDCHCSNDSHQSQSGFNGGNESHSINDELNNHHHAVSSWTEAVHHIVLLTLPLSDFSHSVNE